MTSTWLHRRLAGFALLPALALPGCNIGKIADRTAVRSLAPGMIATADVGLACPAGAALAPVLLAIGHGKPLKKRAPKAEALTLIAAGMCAEVVAWEDELDKLQAGYQLRVGGHPASVGAEQEDALIREVRAHGEAAERNYAAYLRVTEVYGAPSESVDCPARLKAEDELIFLLGMTAGLLATVHDIRGERQVGVPSSLPRDVERGVACLDAARWHDLPRAIEAAVWAAVPGAAPAGADPWAVLEASARAGETGGLWLARALQVQAATSAGAGQEETLKQAIRAHAAARAKGPGDGAYGLLNDYADRMILHASDKVWMEMTGHRTDLGALGEFPSPPPPAAADDDEVRAVREAMEAQAAAEARAAAGEAPGS